MVFHGNHGCDIRDMTTVTTGVYRHTHHLVPKGLILFPENGDTPADLSTPAAVTHRGFGYRILWTTKNSRFGHQRP